MNHIFKKTLNIFVLFTTIALSSTSAYATISNTENVTEKKIQYNPITINYLLEGLNIQLKSPKILDDESDFYDDFTIKLTNNLTNGSIDIQSQIRDYYFSHYEINGKRIESIDSIITLTEDNPIINVIYSEDEQKDGYLRKGFKNGIGIDYDLLSYISDTETGITTELYDETWSILLPSQYCNEIKNINQNLKNANDQTFYLKADTKPLSVKEETDLTKKYNYIDSIKITSSLGHINTTNEYWITYKPINTVLDLKEKTLTLNGLNLEGKIEELSTAIFEKGEVTFAINKNTNNYQYLFISIGVKESPTEDSLDKDDNKISNSVLENLPAIIDQDQKLPNETVTNYNNIQNNEAFVVTIILMSFGVGSISTFILALILSIRKNNIEKRKSK